MSTIHAVDDLLKWASCELKNILSDTKFIENALSMLSEQGSFSPLAKRSGIEWDSKMRSNFSILNSVHADLINILSPFITNAPDGYLLNLFKGQKDGEIKLLFNTGGIKLASLFKEIFENSAIIGHSKSLFKNV